MIDPSSLPPAFKRAMERKPALREPFANSDVKPERRFDKPFTPSELSEIVGKQASQPPQEPAVAALTDSEQAIQAKPQSRWQKSEERKMHDEFEGWLRLHRGELYWDHSRMDRATSNRVGHPDFVIQSFGRVLNIEMKAENGKISDAQADVHAWIERIGGSVHVCRSSQQAIELVKYTLLRS